ncbi:hypothetical protein [Herbiconiux sp.]|jgi:hypothetical protein|uniref:DUF7882 family protein n=1 Tax=Herbiconiux sp. TaxID=1871186 RepID=UPI0025C1BDCF|nr:hypothetical protein [Herbiconiux sp.]
MGKLLYGTHQRELEIDDRTLAHLKVVVITKLRRGETFGLSWEKDKQQGSGRSTIWLSPHIPLEFDFYGGRPPGLNRAWLSMLSESADRGELVLVAEPSESAQRPAG